MPADPVTMAAAMSFDPTTAEPAPPSDKPGHGTSGTAERTRRWWLWAVAALALAAAVLGITSLTGLTGPGPLTRYPKATLDDLVAAVHADAGELRTPDDCWRTTYRASVDEAPDGPPRPIAAVDHLRSRVVVRAHADQVGRIDPRTRREIDRRLDAIVGEDARFEPGMVRVEASPDGWSPLMSCPLVIRGWR